MSSLQIYNDGDFIKVEDLFRYPAFVSEEVFRDQIKFGNFILWNRAGDWRRFPNTILKDVLFAYDMWKIAPVSWSVKPPSTIGLLMWCQGEPLTAPLEQLGQEQTSIGQKANNRPDQ